MRSRLPEPTYANVMATIAVFIALGGGAYAASLPRNSVGASQIRTSAVGAPEIATSAVGASEVRAGAVGSSEVGDNALTGADVDEGTLARVPSAASATTAVAAASAGNAARAANADKLQGATAADLRVKCPAGTLKLLGVCFETGARSQKLGYLDAAQVCSDAGGRLPTWFELNVIRSRTDITWANGQANQYELTGTLDPNDAVAPPLDQVVAIEKAGVGLGNVVPSAQQWFRCVYAPSDAG